MRRRSAHASLAPGKESDGTVPLPTIAVTPQTASALRRPGRSAGPVAVALAIAVACGLAGCDGTLRPDTDAAGRTGPGKSRQQGRPAPREPGRDGGRLPAAALVRIGDVIDARVGRVRDGDSLDAVLPDGRTIGLRIAGIDAPERAQPFADAARRHLDVVAGGRRVLAEVIAIDRYERAVARVWLPTDGPDPAQGSDLGLGLLQAGLAWFVRRHAYDLPADWAPRYDEAENKARRQRTGLWQERTPTPPWRYREALRAR